ncbi:tyrosine-type recombinase/integrase [Clostridium estertheticum]|uniref:tyrosine-type recombinase/integrase n=1 Tax=Clostridium estertheticum TaxID=238834 RepID=UPI001C0CB923|nr:site-specific integrase [Clostridium estertheticum]MBU3075623.1 site-specific integrase [Clostridium estertheticum]MBU3164795.1 site-specific integrase [Clostridium estertheticum]
MAAIEKRGENSYRLTVSLGYNKEGKKQTKKKTIDLSNIPVKKREEEANKQFTLFENDVKKGLFVNNDRITFEEFIDKWLVDYAIPTLAPKTLVRYNEILSRIIPALGHLRLIQLQPTHLMEFYNNLREDGIRKDSKYTPKKNFIEIITNHGCRLNDIPLKCNVTQRTITNLKLFRHIDPIIANKISTGLGLKTNILFDTVSRSASLSERTILYHHRVISSILNTAMQWQFIISNPATRVAPPKTQKKEAKHLDEIQSVYLLELLNNEPIKYKAMVYLSIFGGMRMGELTGLEWSDLDMENGLLSIHQASQYLPGKGIFTKTTKNISSERVISLADAVITILRQYKLWQNIEKVNMGSLWDDKCTRIFTTREGSPIFPTTPGNWFSKFIKKHNDMIMNNDSIKKEDREPYLISTISFHGLRHTSASLLIGEGTDIATVSKRLGHAEISTTLNIYTHSLRKTDREASNKLENILNKIEHNKKQG